VDADPLAFKDLENAREQPPLFGCVYMKLPGHSGSFLREWLRAQKATERIALVAAGFRRKELLHAGTT
jgi:hypothetical protein